VIVFSPALADSPAKIGNVNEARVAADTDGANWLLNGRNFESQHFSPLKQIDKSNVSNLRVAWTWSLPNGQTVELNRDDYTRLPADKRVEVYAKYIEMGVLTPEDVKTMERFYGAATNTAAQALTGGTQ